MLVVYPLLELAAVKVVSPDAVVDSVKDLPVSLDKGLMLSSSSVAGIAGFGFSTVGWISAGWASTTLDFEGRCSSMRDDSELLRFR